jgi:hypothetical protein
MQISEKVGALAHSQFVYLAEALQDRPKLMMG